MEARAGVRDKSKRTCETSEEKCLENSPIFHETTLQIQKLVSVGNCVIFVPQPELRVIFVEWRRLSAMLMHYEIGSPQKNDSD